MPSESQANSLQLAPQHLVSKCDLDGAGHFNNITLLNLVVQMCWTFIEQENAAKEGWMVEGLLG